MSTTKSFPRRTRSTIALLALIATGCTAIGGDSGDTSSLFEGDAKADYAEPRLQLPSPGETVLAATHPRVLVGLGDEFHISALFSREVWGVARRRAHNKQMADLSPWYASLVRYLEGEIAEVAAGGDYTYGADPYVNRLFNHAWLQSPYADYELIGVINRIDRMDFDGGRTCGELRFVYRLAYHKTDLSPAVYSRMPFTLNVVYDVLGSPGPSGWQGCVEAARKWTLGRPLASASDYAGWLAEVADPADRDRHRFRQVEVNFQVVRVPSESKDDLGGHAEYLLRILRPSAADPRILEPVYLENTPDVARLKSSAALRAELVAFIRANVNAIDRGVFQLPEKFLTREVMSFTTHGAHRPGNRPFSQILAPADLAGVDFGGTTLSKTPEALLTRLDDMTCSGCHQRRSVAGFHLLGHDRAEKTHPLNALRLAGSAHFQEEQRRRHSYMWNLTRDARPDSFRPLSFQPFKNSAAPAGGLCFTSSDRQTHFKQGWSCAAGLSCRQIARGPGSPDIGVCVRPASVSVGGDPCLEGNLGAGSTPRSDRMTNSRFGCGAYACLPPEEGTPAGLCYAGCAPGNRAHNSAEICAYNGGASFDTCAASGNFASCLASSISRGLRTACDDSTPCRDDYICQRYFEVSGNRISVPQDARGFCVPTYFVYQMRLDGHPPDPL